MTEPAFDARRLLDGARIMAILTIPDPAAAAPLARALSRGGLRACEVTLRTPAALEAIRAMRDAAPELLVGAGTIRSPADIAAARDAGAQFLVTPGTTPALAAALRAAGLPALPGAASASEIMALAEAGFRALKFFPAAQAGGAPALKALFGPFPEMVFCPTGGVSPENAASFLALPNVICAGGSWIAPEARLAAGDWAGIEAAASAAMAL